MRIVFPRWLLPKPFKYKRDEHGYTTCIHVILITMASKDVGIRIRVEKELREAFQDACTAEHRQVSDVLREFMRAYAEQHDMRQAKLFVESDQRINNGQKSKNN